MIDEKQFREKMAALLRRAEFSHLATYAKEPLIEATIGIAKECEVAEEAAE
jgi:hypothetical protein